LATIIGFIVGSLGVVWPWKKTIFKTDVEGQLLLDMNGSPIIQNYQRFLPELNTETLFAIVYAILGIFVVLALEWYGKKTRKTK
jgi:hypothetical protein